MPLHLLTFTKHKSDGIAIVSALLLLAFAYFKQRKRLSLRLPPGPKPLPIIGNLHQLPKKEEHIEYTKWGKQHGDIVHISVLGSPIIFLSSHQATIELLERRSAIYSERPILTMAGEIVGWDRTVTLSPYNSRYKRFRKLVHGTLGARAAEKYYPMQERLVLPMLESVLEKPQQYVDWIHRFSGAVIVKIAYGRDVEPHDDSYVRRAEQVVKDFSDGTVPGAFLVDSIPMLKHLPSWFPGAGFKRQAEIWRARTDDMVLIPYREVKDQIAAGTAKPCFTVDLLDPAEGPKPTEEEEDVIIWSAGTFYAAGADTSVATTTIFILAMILYRDVQERTRKELDSVTGGLRLPNFGDRPSLPYLEAVLKEVLRWHPVTALGLPHRLKQDDEYKGYHIPSGATVFGNVWALSRDESIYPAPDTFNPTRFLPKPDGSPLPTDPRNYIFGFGRRVCPGQAIAWNQLFIASASLLASFEILPAIDDHGREIMPKEEFHGGIVSRPVPFECRFKPRSENAIDLIKQGVAANKS